MAQILIAGDVCLDVVGVPIAPKVGNLENQENWRLTGEKRTHFLPGGAMLLAEFVRAPRLAEAFAQAEAEVRAQSLAAPKGKKPIPPDEAERRMAEALDDAKKAARTQIEDLFVGPRPIKPQAINGPRGPLLNDDFLALADRLRRDEIVHSLLEADAYPTTADPDEKKRTYRVRHEHGYSGPTSGAPPTLKISYPASDVVPRIMVLDDTGNRFRKQIDTDIPWPDELRNPSQEHFPVVVYKLHRPLPDGSQNNKLWQHVESKFRDQRVVIVGVEDLRSAGAPINRGLSWERTALDLVWHLLNVSSFVPLRDCPRLIIRLGLDGAMLWQSSQDDSGNVQYRAWLIYDPQGIEGSYARTIPGQMVAYASVFTAALVQSLDALKKDIFSELLRRPQPLGSPPSVQALLDAVRAGLLAAQRLLFFGFSDREDRPHYPQSELFVPRPKETMFAVQEVPIVPGALRPDPGYWRLVDSIFENKLGMLHQVVSVVATNRANLKPSAAVLPDDDPRVLLSKIPCGKFGGLTTYDRREIESYRSLHTLLRDYLATPVPPRPLSLAVFGPPGAGKSFGVKEIARSLSGKVGVKDVKALTFNLSLYRNPDELAGAFHLVRDVSLEGKMPLVFFDEFDTSLDGRALGWLRYFLSPMQDGEFLDRGAPHPIGPAIFVFAGGTSANYQEFLTHKNMSVDEFKAVKGPDFLSRLRAKLDIPGLNFAIAYHPLHSNSTDTPDAIARLPANTATFDPFGPVELMPNEPAIRLRRAVVLAFSLMKKAPQLRRGDKSIAINPAVLRALIDLPQFEHGNRSFEALIDMSQLLRRNDFTPSELPAPFQTALHADVHQLAQLIGTEYPFPPAERRVIAQEIHQHFLEQRKAQGEYRVDKPSHQPWDSLPIRYKTSNEDQAEDIPRKLRLVGLWFRKIPAVSNHALQAEVLSVDQIEFLAQLEHDRWVANQRLRGYTFGPTDDSVLRTHPCILPWNDPRLSEGEKNKDRDAVRSMPRYLRAAGYEIVPFL